MTQADNKQTKTASTAATTKPKKNWHNKAKMSAMPLHRLVFAQITLGLLSGWYYFICLLYPILLILAFYGSWVAGTIFATLVALAYIPMKFKHWDGFMYSFLFDCWREYFDYSYDNTNIKGKIVNSKRYIFFVFPHGIFPMGQVISASLIREITPGKMVCGTGADVIFSFPIMRHIMAWVGTRPAKRDHMQRIFEEGHFCAVIPGGIAEMYVTSTAEETIYLKKRQGTVKLAIQQGANIVPVFFFGNTKIFDTPSTSSSESFFSRISRKIRASIIFFYGYWYLPIPYRHPIRMVFGDIIEVKQNANPTEEEINDTLQRVIANVEKLYKEKKPEWEERPLVIL